jgi:hypothetical protein
MPNMRHHFSALLSAINPSEHRSNLARDLPGEVRAFLEDHEFATACPHTRLSGSYARDTAISDIKDVDVLLFIPDSHLERTPNSVLLDVKRVLDDYPDASAETSGQRRSVHLEFTRHDLHLDIVPVVAPDGADAVLMVPDRPQKEWIKSDPLGYATRLSELNQKHGSKVKPLIKLVKAWRDVQMKIRRPKSYVLEVMILAAVEDGMVELCDQSTAQNVADFFSHIVAKYDDLMDNGSESPRIADPQVGGAYITSGWSRAHFETFMRRAREADRACERALQADTSEDAAAEWQIVFGNLWPDTEVVKAAVRAEAASVRPGTTLVGMSGLVIGPSAARTVPTRQTSYHGD